MGRGGAGGAGHSITISNRHVQPVLSSIGFSGFHFNDHFKIIVTKMSLILLEYFRLGSSFD